MLKKIVLRFLMCLKYDVLIEKLIFLFEQIKIKRYEELCGSNINYVNQGRGGLIIAGDLTKFFIDATSHLKSNTFIECSGGVKIGRYFHCGRGLTIFSTSHNYRNATKIPYDKFVINKPINIGDFVWCGTNVTILPGITISDGVIIGAGSVVTRDIPKYAVVGGNPAKIISYRDIEQFEFLKEKELWY